MRVAIYLGNNEGPSVDARNITKGNPGVGGAHYCLLMLAHYLSENEKYDVHVITVREYLLNDRIRVIKVTDENQVIKAAENINTDILILKHFPNSILEDHIQKSNLKIIVWSHNFLSSKFCKYISSTSQIKRNVFVGKQQYDAYLDDNVIKKSTFIYNMVSGIPSRNRKNDGRTVVFVGAICRKKGFLEMCRIWPGIIRDVPDAKLLVLGNGKLYGDAKMGPYGIANENYERQFIPYITDESGNIIPSVEFMGIVGDEKNEIFSKASVGVLNPSGARETFGMVAVEMGLSGLPAVSVSSPGYYDTIHDNVNGFLAGSLPELQHNIIKLLTDSNLNTKLGGVLRRLPINFHQK